MIKQHDFVFVIPDYESESAFPLGAATLAAVLQRDGVSVGIVDANSAAMTPAECVSRIMEMQPAVLGITGLWANVDFLCKVSNQLHERAAGIKQIAGGWWAMTCPDIMLELSSVDCVVRGEADSIITDLCRVFLDGKSPERFNGVYTRDNIGKYSSNDPYLQASDINSLPEPAYELFDMDNYFHLISIYGKLQKFSYLSLDYLREYFGDRSDLIIGTAFTGRGCYGKCTFCSAAGQLRRNFPVNSVVNNMAHLKNHYGVDVFHFDDSLTFSTRRWVQEFCRTLIKRDLKILYRSQMRADFNYDSETLTLLRESGCYEIMFGIESGDSQMLQNMKKGKNVNVELNEKVIRDFREARIFVRGSFILNMPGETEDTLQSSIDFARRTRIVASWGLASPYPGTELYQYCVENGYVKDEKDLLDIGDGDNSSLTFSGHNASRQFEKYYRQFNYNNLSRETLIRAEKELSLVLYINKLANRRKWLYYIFRTVPALAAAIQRISRLL